MLSGQGSSPNPNEFSGASKQCAGHISTEQPPSLASTPAPEKAGDDITRPQSSSAGASSKTPDKNDLSNPPPSHLLTSRSASESPSSIHSVIAPQTEHNPTTGSSTKPSSPPPTLLPSNASTSLANKRAFRDAAGEGGEATDDIQLKRSKLSEKDTIYCEHPYAKGKGKSPGPAGVRDGNSSEQPRATAQSDIHGHSRKRHPDLEEYPSSVDLSSDEGDSPKNPIGRSKARDSTGTYQTELQAEHLDSQAPLYPFAVEESHPRNGHPGRFLGTSQHFSPAVRNMTRRRGSGPFPTQPGREYLRSSVPAHQLRPANQSTPASWGLPPRAAHSMPAPRPVDGATTRRQQQPFTGLLPQAQQQASFSLASRPTQDTSVSFQTARRPLPGGTAAADGSTVEPGTGQRLGEVTLQSTLLMPYCPSCQRPF
jgi:hypothetical protein